MSILASKNTLNELRLKILLQIDQRKNVRNTPVNSQLEITDLLRKILTK